MLSNNLNTNEVRNAAGSEMEFQHIDQSGRARTFALVSEAPAFEHRLSIKHGESGEGMKRRRRSLIRVDKTLVSDVNDVTPVTVSAYIVLDAPIGALETNAAMKDVLAELGSFTFSGGSVILLDGTGTGSACLLSGGL